jgi:hypothetical protein
MQFTATRIRQKGRRRPFAKDSILPSLSLTIPNGRTIWTILLLSATVKGRTTRTSILQYRKGHNIGKREITQTISRVAPNTAAFEKNVTCGVTISEGM